MPYTKRMKKKTNAAESAKLAAMKATRGPAVNLRPGGAMHAANTRRDRTRSDRRRNALREWGAV